MSGQRHSLLLFIAAAMLLGGGSGMVASLRAEDTRDETAANEEPTTLPPEKVEQLRQEAEYQASVEAYVAEHGIREEDEMPPPLPKSCPVDAEWDPANGGFGTMIPDTGDKQPGPIADYLGSLNHVALEDGSHIVWVFAGELLDGSGAGLVVKKEVRDPCRDGLEGPPAYEVFPVEGVDGPVQLLSAGGEEVLFGTRSGSPLGKFNWRTGEFSDADVEPAATPES